MDLSNGVPVPVECGCTIYADHVTGDRAIRCVNHQIEYIIRAREVRTVEYTAVKSH
jgi:hypothetical protein